MSKNILYTTCIYFNFILCAFLSNYVSPRDFLKIHILRFLFNNLCSPLNKSFAINAQLQVPQNACRVRLHNLSLLPYELPKNTNFLGLHAIN